MRYKLVRLAMGYPRYSRIFDRKRDLLDMISQQVICLEYGEELIISVDEKVLAPEPVNVLHAEILCVPA